MQSHGNKAGGVLSLIVAGLIACSSPTPEGAAPKNPDSEAATPSQGEFVICKEPRSQACTRDYAPVCAHTMQGSLETRPNGCTACADPQILGHRPGPCS